MCHFNGLELNEDELKALQRSAAIYVEAIKTLGYK
jgi:hypothetical protein